jgi:hypothetical protein
MEMVRQRLEDVEFKAKDFRVKKTFEHIEETF